MTKSEAEELLYPDYVELEVTQEHIERGTRLDSHCCPIALAMEDAGYRKPRVDCYSANAFKNDGLPCMFRMSEPATDFVRAFDAGARVVPLKLRLYDLRLRLRDAGTTIALAGSPGAAGGYWGLLPRDVIAFVREFVRARSGVYLG